MVSKLWQNVNLWVNCAFKAFYRGDCSGVVIAHLFYDVTVMTLQWVARVHCAHGHRTDWMCFLILSGWLADGWTLHQGIWEASVVLWQCNRHENNKNIETSDLHMHIKNIHNRAENIGHTASSDVKLGPIHIRGRPINRFCRLIGTDSWFAELSIICKNPCR